MPNESPKVRAPRIVEASFAAAAAAAGELPPPVGLEFVFAGRSNVGKSSLMNALMARRNLVRTSSTPGCTRKIGFYAVRLANGARMTLVDLPGYGFAKRSKGERNAWADLIESYLLERPTLAGAAVLVDARRGVEEEERDLFTLLEGPARVARRPLAIELVATKLDRLPSSARVAAVRAVTAGAGRRAHGVSTLLPETLTALWARLTARLELAAPETPTPGDEP